VKGRARLRGDGYGVLPLRTSVVLPAVRAPEPPPSRHPFESALVFNRLKLQAVSVVKDYLTAAGLCGNQEH